MDERTIDRERGIERAAPVPREKCVVLVPAMINVEPRCEQVLRVLESRGYAVRRRYGSSQIDLCRSQMASDALREGFEETLWIDADMVFEPDDVERLRAHGLPIACGIYPKKGTRALSCHALPGTEQIIFGEQGGLTEILYAATGFLLVRPFDCGSRSVWLAACLFSRSTLSR